MATRRRYETKLSGRRFLSNIFQKAESDGDVQETNFNASLHTVLDVAEGTSTPTSPHTVPPTFEHTPDAFVESNLLKYPVLLACLCFLLALLFTWIWYGMAECWAVKRVRETTSRDAKPEHDTAEHTTTAQSQSCEQEAPCPLEMTIAFIAENDDEDDLPPPLSTIHVMSGNNSCHRQALIDDNVDTVSTCTWETDASFRCYLQHDLYEATAVLSGMPGSNHKRIGRSVARTLDKIMMES